MKTDAKGKAGIRGLLLDLDGVFTIGGEVLPGAVETLDFLISAKIPYRFTTNTTTQSRETLARRISAVGLAVKPDEIISAPYAAVLYLRQLGRPSCRLIVAADIAADFAEFPHATRNPDVIVIGDIGGRWCHEILNDAFREVMQGARMVALHKGRFWQEPDGLRLDIGAYVAALEYATGQTATVIGKPSPSFFELAARDLKLPPESLAMIGDDIISDVGGAQKAGLRGILVKTGKYRAAWARSSGVVPDATIAGISDLPGLLPLWTSG